MKLNFLESLLRYVKKHDNDLITLKDLHFPSSIHFSFDLEYGKYKSFLSNTRFYINDGSSLTRDYYILEEDFSIQLTNPYYSIIKQFESMDFSFSILSHSRCDDIEQIIKIVDSN